MHKHSLAVVAFWLLAQVLLAPSLVLAEPPGGTTGGLAPPSAEDDAVNQDESWLRAKQSGALLFGADPMAALLLPAETLPNSKILVAGETQHFIEPLGSGKDALGKSYTDRNYWNFCVPGATAVATYYFGVARVMNWPAGTFTEPYGPFKASTYWKPADTVNGYTAYARSFLMHMAEQVEPPTWSRPGVVSFDAYPTTGGTLSSARDAINWEASGHSSGWATFYYTRQSTSSSRFTETQMHADIAWAIYLDNAPIVVSVNTYVSSSLRLPNWTRSVGHAITVIGYNDLAGTYRFVDTCGKACNGSSGNTNGGTYDIDQHSLFLLVEARGNGYLY